jgi:hypothetical protein
MIGFRQKTKENGGALWNCTRVWIFIQAILTWLCNSDTRGSGWRPTQVAQSVLAAVFEVKPVDMGLFAGVLDYRKYSAGMGAVMRYKMRSKGVKEGDYRDWDGIQAWAVRAAGPIDRAAAKS